MKQETPGLPSSISNTFDGTAALQVSISFGGRESRELRTQPPTAYSVYPCFANISPSLLTGSGSDIEVASIKPVLFASGNEVFPAFGIDITIP